ncbi:DNA polymerase III subunit alpha [Lysinibacillus pakistanensis]|uniref:DNA-directed DNA polymerase n=1 Tax=Lysinibacillus pakistanensis TaxID=759811 RepID=A0AAX3WTM6_9BACI|nr:DNA polymerase III subunit alpha [Lysinibacillus pakistanensis]MDM5229879.1 DNA polymerase III subunit alpha [Lysinibacillus pakistanensis]WHY45479.1 DNA polymerase III subunit alpha [Lysinibacillus pakistanensis]WHY50487.1 DNA polymerase III subunit alpha [Lysinibacillus pakistanensis]
MTHVYTKMHTSADLLKSTIRLEQLIPFLQEQKTQACAIVNSKLYGLLPFCRALQQANIHAVVGLSINIQWQELQIPLVLYAKTQEGYQHLLKISSAVSIREDEVLPWKWLKGYAAGCIALLSSNDIMEIGHWTEAASALKALFGQHLFMGVARPAGMIAETEQDCVTWCKNESVPLVASQSCYFLRPEDHFAYEVVRAIDTGEKCTDTKVSALQGYFVPTQSEWSSWFADRPEWLEASAAMLASCTAKIPHMPVQMPKFPVPIGETAENLLVKEAFTGLTMRFNEHEIPPAYKERLQYELEIICSMGFADYFLIVADFMQYAKENQILTGPGRGSSAGSLVAYSLSITQVDPLAYGLIFERFLNPERISLPDIDIDFVDNKRQKVIQYVAHKYGKANVAQIITFGTLSAKAVARDVARALGFEAETLEKISKLIPNKPGMTLQKAVAESQGLQGWIAEDEKHRRWLEVALKLEGLPRNSSTHAAGVVLAPSPLVNTMPIEKGHDDIYCTQWPMGDVEACGLVKMDFLGLRNLTILEQIRWSIYKARGPWIEFERIPMQDEKTFQLLQRGDTLGIFQLESEGMKQALRDIKPTHFLDIVAVNALYRPGPMDFIPIYAKRKSGQELVVMPHPVLEPILQETFGVIVYQEQIMQIASIMAGFSMGQADLLRRAVSKKNRQVLEEQRAVFVNGAMKQGYDIHIAEEVYALIVRFADYGFPKSHAVAYSVISYQMAYLKAHYPKSFYAALLSNATGNVEKIQQLVNEAKEQGIIFYPPSLKHSTKYFTVENDGIRYSLSGIKGVPHPLIEMVKAIQQSNVEALNNLFDLAVALSAQHFKPKVIESLIFAGALDYLEKDRAVLIKTVEAALKHAELLRPTVEIDWASATAFSFGKPKYMQAQEMTQKEKLMHEKEVLGFYISAHPVTEERAFWPDANVTCRELKHTRDGTYVKVIGLIEEIKKIRTKRGEQMAFAQLQDEYGTVSITLFPQVFQLVQDFLKEDEILYIEGTVERRFGKAQVKVKHAQTTKKI